MSLLANGAMFGGHETIQDRAFISGNCLVHQFCRVGTLALMQGGSAISKDLPPFTIARGDNGICGLNVVGLRRAGFSAAERLELKQLYHALFRSQNQSARSRSSRGGKILPAPAAKLMLEFIAAAKRGVCTNRGQARGVEDE